MTRLVKSPVEIPTPELDRWLREMRAMTGLKQSEVKRVFESVLETLGGHLPLAHARGLMDQLPASINECLDRAIQQCSAHERHDFVAHVRSACPTLAPQQVERAIWAVFTILSHHLAPQLIRQVRDQLPEMVRALWNTAA